MPLYTLHAARGIHEPPLSFAFRSCEAHRTLHLQQKNLARLRPHKHERGVKHHPNLYKRKESGLPL